MKKLLLLATLFVATLGFVSADEKSSASSATAASSDGDTVEVTFTYKPTRREAATVKEVTVAGAFNTWDPYATAMTKQEDGTWSVTVKVPKGAGQWKYLVNGNWIQNMEPAADRITPKPDRFVNDPYGGKNCENDF
jgi:1,4-alpha-glucan branching enzyme